MPPPPQWPAVHSAGWFDVFQKDQLAGRRPLGRWNSPRGGGLFSRWVRAPFPWIIYAKEGKVGFRHPNSFPSTAGRIPLHPLLVLLPVSPRGPRPWSRTPPPQREAPRRPLASVYRGYRDLGHPSVRDLQFLVVSPYSPLASWTLGLRGGGGVTR